MDEIVSAALTAHPSTGSQSAARESLNRDVNQGSGGPSTRGRRYPSRSGREVDREVSMLAPRTKGHMAPVRPPRPLQACRGQRSGLLHRHERRSLGRPNPGCQIDTWPGGVASSPRLTCRACGSRSGCNRSMREAGPPMQVQSSSQSVERSQDRSAGKITSGRRRGLELRARQLAACEGPASVLPLNQLHPGQKMPICRGFLRWSQPGSNR